MVEGRLNTWGGGHVGRMIQQRWGVRDDASGAESTDKPNGTNCGWSMKGVGTWGRERWQTLKDSAVHRTSVARVCEPH